MQRLLASLILSACLAASAPQAEPRVRLLVDGRARDIAAGDLIPAHILKTASVSFSPNDQILVNGSSVSPDQPLQGGDHFILQLRRAVAVTIFAPNGQLTINTAAFTVGEALREAGIASFGARDRIEPPANTFVTSGMLIHVASARPMTVTAGDKTVTAYTSAPTIFAGMAEAGIPLMGLDRSAPGENEAFPGDGQMRMVRVSEAMIGAYKAIQNETQLIVTTELEPPLQDTLEAGAIGLAFERTRIRYEDGVEVGRAVESETVIRKPQARVVRSSYWAAKQMYATSYSPCRSGVDGCLNGTSSGMTVQRGVVAMYYEWYLALGGVRVFIPGYGIAVIGDVGGGFPDRRPWIDLGFSDADYEEWSGWVTVYFLAPAPIEVPWFLR
ncbi:MAG: hypothetical protein HFACDABA_02380 [Anaerolineales bacterium]|nr:hypothetical protein [Anaerolineales bacterium]